MSVARTRRAVATHTTRAFLLRKIAHSETHSVVTFLTEELGRVSALARHAERSRRRFGGSLEAMHTLEIRIEEQSGRELLQLTEATIAVVRSRLLTDLAGLEAAGQALGWVRRVAPARQREPGLWAVLSGLLDALDSRDEMTAPRVHLAIAGLGLLGELGWGMDFGHCVRCGKACEPKRAAMIDPSRGGAVCRACGGARLCLSAAQRGRLLDATQSRARASPASALSLEDAAVAIDIIEQGLAAHAGLKL